MYKVRIIFSFFIIFLTGIFAITDFLTYQGFLALFATLFTGIAAAFAIFLAGSETLSPEFDAGKGFAATAVMMAIVSICLHHPAVGICKSAAHADLSSAAQDAIDSPQTYKLDSRGLASVEKLHAACMKENSTQISSLTGQLGQLMSEPLVSIGGRFFGWAIPTPKDECAESYLEISKTWPDVVVGHKKKADCLFELPIRWKF